MTPEDQQIVYDVLRYAYRDLYAVMRSCLAALEKTGLLTREQLQAAMMESIQEHKVEFLLEAEDRFRRVVPPPPDDPTADPRR